MAGSAESTGALLLNETDRQLRFDGKVAVITGAGGALGSSYARLFASRGAKVVVNDVFKPNADKVVQSIKSQGGDALANYDDVAAGGNLIKETIDKYGRVDILILNAGILRDKSFKAMTDEEWHSVYQTHLKGAFTVAKAAWPHMRKQKYGRIITTASAAGIYSNFGQANYSAAKFGLISFAKCLAIEGVKYNINCNAIAPIAASAMTRTIMPEEMLAHLSPEFIAPFVAYLCHQDTKETGSTLELGAGWAGKIRWEMSNGHTFGIDESYTPSAVGLKMAQIHDFTGATHPPSLQSLDLEGLLKKSAAAPPNAQGPVISFDNQVVLVTGAGGGIGRADALLYAKLGGKVVVNDMNKAAADKVVAEIKAAGGQAVANYSNVESGQSLVDTALQTFGGIHVVVNNAGILRDKSMASMTEKEWDDIFNCHLHGTYSVCKAAWPHFLKQKYGRILNTGSLVGQYGNFGQANYSAAKAAITAFTRTLSIEGKKYNILANSILPNAASQLTATVWDAATMSRWPPHFNSPISVYITSSSNTMYTGFIYQPTGGNIATYRWQRSHGYALSNKRTPTPEDVKAHWDDFTRFDERSSNPDTFQGALEAITSNFGKGDDTSASSASASNADPEDSELVKKAKAIKQDSYEFNYTERDSIIYNLGIGCTEKELKYTFEQDDNFMVLPTFAVIPPFEAITSAPLDWLPNFSPMMLLHGEQYIEILKPIPTSGSLVNQARLEEVLDKGKAAAVTSVVDTHDKKTGDLVFRNRNTVFIRGSGGFGGRTKGKDYGAATALNQPPSRKADNIAELKTEERQAAIYRTSGDLNPLHISPDFAKAGGFEKPILHGLCFFGIVGKHLYETYGPYKDMKVRFAGSLYAGETITVESWKEGNKVIYVAKCKERNTVILSNAAITLA